MFLYALYYYDRPLLEAWLNHYCSFDCITEIIIQDQNWSDEDTLYLLETVANYVDHFNKKIVVLPSNFIRVEGESKRSQFICYGQAKIRNRVMQFLQNKAFIASSIDEVLYSNCKSCRAETSYRDTDKKFKLFEKLAEERAKKGKSTVGFAPLYCVWKDGVYPCDEMPMQRLEKPTWRHRLFRFVHPFRRKPSLVHNTTYQIYMNNKWCDATPPFSAKSKQEIYKLDGVPLNLNLLHYHTLIHPSYESAKYIIPKKNEIKNITDHPPLYLNTLLNYNPVKVKEEEAKPVKKIKEVLLSDAQKGWLIRTRQIISLERQPFITVKIRKTGIVKRPGNIKSCLVTQLSDNSWRFGYIDKRQSPYDKNYTRPQLLVERKNNQCEITVEKCESRLTLDLFVKGKRRSRSIRILEDIGKNVGKTVTCSLI